MNCSKLRVVVFTIVAGILWLLCSAVTSPGHAASTLDQIKKRGKLVAGVRFDYPPFGFVDKEGKPIGFGVDIAAAIAKKLGVGIEYFQVTAQTRIPLLQNETIDGEFGATTATKKREEVVDFSIIYCWETISVLIRQGELKGERTRVTDLAPPKVVGFIQGSSFIAEFERRMPNAQKQLYQEYPDAVLALVNKKVDALVVGKYTAHQFMKKQKGLQVLDADFSRDPVAIMVRPNDSSWRNYINWTIQEMWAQGSFQKIFEQHFGYAPDFQLWSPYGLQPGIGQ